MSIHEIRVTHSSRFANLALSALALGSIGVMTDWDPAAAATRLRENAEAGCDFIGRTCPWEHELPALVRGAGSGKLTGDTRVLSVEKSFDAEYSMKRKIKGTDIVIDSAESAQRGTVVLDGEVHGIVSVDYRSNGEVTVLSAGGQPIDISEFKFTANQPREAEPNGTCPPLEEGEMYTGCVVTENKSGRLDGTPIFGANNDSTISTKVAEIAWAYQNEERCVYDYILIPMLNEAATKYGIENLNLSGSDKYQKADVIFIVGSQKKRFSAFNSAQKTFVPVTGKTRTPMKIEEIMATLSGIKEGILKIPKDIKPDYCVSEKIDDPELRAELKAQVAQLLMYYTAPDYFNPETMEYEYGNEDLTAPTAEQLERAGL